MTLRKNNIYFYRDSLKKIITYDHD